MNPEPLRRWKGSSLEEEGEELKFAEAVHFFQMDRILAICILFAAYPDLSENMFGKFLFLHTPCEHSNAQESWQAVSQWIQERTFCFIGSVMEGKKGLSHTGYIIDLALLS